MLQRYNTETESPSCDNSWPRTDDDLLNPAQDNSNDKHYISDIPPPMSLPRAKVATIKRHSLSTMFHSRNSIPLQSDSIDHSHQLPDNEYHEDFKYNIPLEEKFHQQKQTNLQEL